MNRRAIEAPDRRLLITALIHRRTEARTWRKVLAWFLEPGAILGAALV
jgi:hypothetical protein